MKRGLSQTRKLWKSFLLESSSAWKWDGVVAATLHTLRTNAAKHCGRQWRKQRLPSFGRRTTTVYSGRGSRYRYAIKFFWDNLT